MVEQSKFIRSLEKLSTKQQQRYMEFLQSPYFNKNSEITRFVEQVLSFDTVPNPEKLYKILYPGKDFEKRRIADLMYKSLKLLEEFLSEERYAGQPWERKLGLLSYIRQYNISGLNNAVQAEITELRSKKQHRDSNYFYEEFMYQSEADKIFLSQARIKGDQSLQKKVDQLDLFYLAAKLRDSCEMMGRKRILAADFDFHLLDNLLEAIQADLGRYEQYPAILIYYRIILMLRDQDDTAHFYKLQQDVYQYLHLFVQDEQRSLYGYLQNYCIRMVNSGQAGFYSELLGIYKYMITNKLMEEDNKNLQWDLKNMVSVALRLGEYDWAYQVINTLKPKLPPDSRENAYSYNIANYYFETKDYKKATRLLQSVDFSDIYYNLDSKAMLLKIYFEQEETEAFYALVASFNTYLNRNKLISHNIALTYANLIKFSRKAFVFKTQLPYERRNNAAKIKTLKNTVTETRNIVNLNWLLKEIEAMG